MPRALVKSKCALTLTSVIGTWDFLSIPHCQLQRRSQKCNTWCKSNKMQVRKYYKSKRIKFCFWGVANAELLATFKSIDELLRCLCKVLARSNCHQQPDPISSYTLRVSEFFWYLVHSKNSKKRTEQEGRGRGNSWLQAFSRMLNLPQGEPGA